MIGKGAVMWSESRRRLVVAVAAAAVLLVWGAGIALGHAVLLRSDPGFDKVVHHPPDSVTLEYSEPVDLALGAVRVFDSNAQRVDAGEAGHVSGRQDAITVALQSELPDGTYTVTWQVISADSHPIRGAFVFHIGAPGAQPGGIAEEVLGAGSGRLTGVLFGVVRWVSFSAMLVLVGAAAFAVLIWRQEKVVSRPAYVERFFGRRWRRILAWSTGVLLVGTILSIVMQGAVAAGVPFWEAFDPNIVSEVLGTRYGTVAIFRMALLLAGAGLWTAARRGRVSLLRESREGAPASLGAAAPGEAIPPWALIGGALILAALITTPALAGHAGQVSPVALNVATDAVHVGAASLWIGGLVALLGCAFIAARNHPEVLGPVVIRYSTLAVWSVAALVLTGVFRGWMEIRYLDEVVGSTYGLILLAKVGAFLPLIALGAINNRKRIPRIASGGGDRVAALGRLRRAVGAEVAIAVAVIAVTAALVNTSPPRSAEREEGGAASGPVAAEVALGEGSLAVLVDPGTVGENIVHLTATEQSGAPAEIKAMTARFFMDERDIGPLIIKGHELAAGHFAVHNAQLAVGGEWRIEIVARFDRFTQERATATVTIGD